MSRDKAQIAKRNIALCKDFKKLSAVKEFGKPKYNHLWIMAKLAVKYFLTDETVYFVIRNEPEKTGYTVPAIPTDQTELFDES